MRTTMGQACASWAALAMVGATPASAITRHVPAEYATIQAGIDASVAGDSVLVGPGT